MQLLTLPTLDVAATGSGARSGPSFAVTGPSGEPLGDVRTTHVSWDGRLRRLFGNAAQYPFTLTLTDPAGAVVLHMDKARENALGRHLRVTVRLADGRTLGVVHQRSPLSGRITFHGAVHTGKDGGTAGRGGDDVDAEVAAAEVGSPSAPLEVVAVPAGTPVWGRREFVLSRPELGARAYRLHFAPDAPVLVRALLLAWTVTSDAQLLPGGGGY